MKPENKLLTKTLDEESGSNPVSTFILKKLKEPQPPWPEYFGLKRLSLLTIIIVLTGIILLLVSAPVIANNDADNFPDNLGKTQFQENIGGTDVVTFTIYLPIIYVSPTGWQPPQTSGTTNLLNGAGCNGSNCVAGGPGLNVYTNDGGSNWTSVTSGLTNITLYDVSCATTTKCVAVGKSTGSNGIILVSNDGGQSWSSSFNQSYQMNAVDCPLADQCFAVGDESEARYVLDGDTSNWQGDRLGNTPLYGIDCFGNRHCWMVGLGGRVIGIYPLAAGPDGIGVITKKDLFLSPVRTLLAIGCSGTDGQHCVTVGDLGAVAKTINGGGSWSKPNSGTTENLNGVSCPTASHCYAVGNNGTLLISEDGGTTWNPETSPTSENLNDIECFAESSNCFAVGANGTILRRY